MKVKNRIFIGTIILVYIFIMGILGVFYFENIAFYKSDTEKKSQFFIRDEYADKWRSLGENIDLSTNSLGMSTLQTDYISVSSKRNTGSKALKYLDINIVKQRDPVYYEVMITNKIMAATNTLENTEFVYTFGDWSRLQYKIVNLGNNEDNDSKIVFGIQTEEIIKIFQEKTDYYKDLLEKISREEYCLNKSNIVVGMVTSSVIMLLLLCFCLSDWKKLFFILKLKIPKNLIKNT